MNSIFFLAISCLPYATPEATAIRQYCEYQVEFFKEQISEAQYVSENQKWYMIGKFDAYSDMFRYCEQCNINFQKTK